MKKLFVFLVVLVAVGALAWNRFRSPSPANLSPAVASVLPKSLAPTAHPAPLAVATAPTKKALPLVPRNEVLASTDGSGYPPLALE
jgi:hypothetical protein